MKRISALILAGSLALSLVGCGNTDTENKNHVSDSKTEQAADNKESQTGGLWKNIKKSYYYL